MAFEGGVGVSVFFGISGFILALPFARHYLFNTAAVDLRSYYIRRLTRLEPPYIISLIIFLLVHLIILHENFRDIFPNFVASLFYVHNIVFNQWSVINPVAWSLEVEVQFYLLAPLLAGVFAISDTTKRRLVIVLVILISILHYNLNYEWIHEMHLRKSLLVHLHQFFIGFLFADIFLVSWRSSAGAKSYGFDMLGILGMVSVLIWNDPYNLLHDIIFTISLLISFMGIFKGRLLNRFYTNPIIVIIGGMCYSIYLLHYALIAFLADHTKSLIDMSWSYGLNLLLQGIIIIPIILIVSAVFFILIERPCMDKAWPTKLKTKLVSIFAPAVR